MIKNCNTFFLKISADGEILISKDEVSKLRCFMLNGSFM